MRYASLRVVTRCDRDAFRISRSTRVLAYSRSTRFLRLKGFHHLWREAAPEISSPSRHKCQASKASTLHPLLASKCPVTMSFHCISLHCISLKCCISGTSSHWKALLYCRYGACHLCDARLLHKNIGRHEWWQCPCLWIHQNQVFQAFVLTHRMPRIAS